MKAFFVVTAIAILLLTGCAKVEKRDKMQDVSFETDDEVKIVGTFYEGGSDGILLLHKLNSNRNEWTDFALKLQNMGYSVLTIDFRGHGDSDGDWKEFSEEDFNAMTLDVEASVRYMKKRNVTNITIMGASIGANIALNYAVGHGIKKIVLLSPGLNYRGVETEDVAKSYEGSMLIAVSNEDKYSLDSSKVIYAVTKAKKELKIYEGAAHGVAMLEGTDLSSAIIDWLKT
ncbi:alpha/beta fold hydrolase [Candidatus Woesearchaeota archaeon]|nr:alpha/beta fold hydrolase [Candidatus Woesearchaeota archaeon]